MMLIFRKMTKVILAGLIGVGFTSQAEATCVAQGKIMYATSGTDNILWVYLAPTSGQIGNVGFTYYYQVPPSYGTIREILIAATANDRTIKIEGNATYCPTSGPQRFGGQVNHVYLSHLH